MEARNTNSKNDLNHLSIDELGDRENVVCHSPLRKGFGKNISTLHKQVSTIDTCLVSVSLITWFVDTTTDLLVGAQYMQGGQYYWGGLTFSFILGPSIIIQIFSGRWYAADGLMRGWGYWLVHILQLEPLERYLVAIVSGLKARGSTDPEVADDYYYKQNDVCMLRLFEAFLESAPQLTLQLYIILCTQCAHWLTVVSASISLVALGWAVAAYSHALRKAYRDEYRVFWPSLLLQTLSHIGVVAARVLAIVAFSSVFKAWVFLILGVHWVVMTVWVILQSTDFCQTRAEEFLFDCIIGVVYCFSFFNLKEGRTRWRILGYYVLMVAENALLVAVWYPFRDLAQWYNEVMLIGISASLCFGLLCMVLYYRFCHPSGPIYCCWPKDKDPSYHGTPQPVRIYHAKAADLPQHLQSTPVAPRQVDLLPRHTSTGLLPRRVNLLKQQSRSEVAYQQVCTPSQLSPIKGETSFHMDHSQESHNVMTDETSLQLNDLSCEHAYQHYSVDASLCFARSKCNTLDFSGVDLSHATDLDSDARASHRPSRLQRSELFHVPEEVDEDDNDSVERQEEEAACEMFGGGTECSRHGLESRDQSTAQNSALYTSIPQHLLNSHDFCDSGHCTQTSSEERDKSDQSSSLDSTEYDNTPGDDGGDMVLDQSHYDNISSTPAKRPAAH